MLLACGSSNVQHENSNSTSNEQNTGVHCSRLIELPIVAASDDGSHDDYEPNKSIDGDLASASRWSSDGVGKYIIFDLAEVVKIKQLQVLWFEGDSRNYYFDIDISHDKAQWTSVLVSGQSSGSQAGYELIDIDDTDGRYVRITGQGNSVDAWNSIVESQIWGCLEGDKTPTSEPTPVPTPEFNLDANLPPSGNFDLQDWTLGVPVDNNNDGKSDTIKENELANGYVHSDWFYTAADGGMVFKAPIDAPKTSTNTSYTRSELREMLRRGDSSIKTQGINQNNWIFSSYSPAEQAKAGGVDGELTATLKVDHVTTTGSSGQVGRVIVGQIHAKDDEPARLYYRLLPGHSKGSIYLAHEPTNGNSEQWYNMIGTRSNSAAEPADGIALGEVFSYSIKVTGHMLTVTIYRDGKADVVQTVDMSDSGFHTGTDQYMYFKAGVYNQNNSGDPNDFVQATFYRLHNTHSGYDH
ncbi:cyclic nucleotide-binding domain-containing protein [Catenovulum agarivorans DS-2]|uniref:Cyclic nucleotide-binding domain-containing protein n=2 Tax=Catenovulum agarivorans TaxID=1172192 RepID=W7Q9J0_9ALTE|nr:cyclic nucleotide-binding domain-containing protein [Catenovulum agarivorans DS-2]